MKKSVKIIALTVVAILVVSCFAVLGANISKQVDIYYRNIKININGTEHNPTNAQGETVEPFIYDGTTYLPVRAVADALGMDVAWDDATSTVTLTDKSSGNVNKEFVRQENEFHAKIEKRLEAVMPKEDLDKEILADFSGIPVSAASVRYAVLASATYHENADDEETKKQIAKEIDDYYRTNAAVVLMASELGIDVPDNVFEADIAGVYTSMSTLYGDSLKEIIETYTFQSTYFYFLNQYYNILYSKLFEAKINDSDFEKIVREKVLAAMTTPEKPYVRAKHILVAFEEGATDEQKAEKKALAETILARAKAGEDFDALVKEYGEDPGMESNPDGYYFTYGTMVEPFENTAFALKEGEISEPVETNFGYHIIQRLPLDDDAIKNTDEYKNAGYQLLMEEVTARGASLTATFADNYDERCAQFAQ